LSKGWSIMRNANQGSPAFTRPNRSIFYQFIGNSRLRLYIAR